MDGGGRLGRTLGAWPGRIAEAFALSRAGRAARRRRAPGFHIPRGIGSSLALLYVVCAGALGLSYGGHIEAMRRDQGTLQDLLARAMGFGIHEIAVSGNSELTQDEVISLSGVTPLDSMPFLEPRQVQQRLLDVPMIVEAAISKLYPDKLRIQIKERVPFALWQLDGRVQVIAADGTPIETLNDPRFLRLPHVVGKDANLRVKEYVALVEAAPSLAGKIRAGTLIAGRRWTLKLKNGVEVKLPEEAPEAALKAFAAVERDSALSERAVLAIDLRIPNRLVVRLTEEAAAQYGEGMAGKLKKLGGGRV